VTSKSYDIVIIGAGFSGCATAYALRHSGLSVAVVDSISIAAGASGNEQAHLVPYSTAPDFPGHEFYTTGFHYTAKLFEQLHDEGMLPSLRCMPAIQFPTNDRPKRVIERLATGALITDEVALLANDQAPSWLTHFTPSTKAIYPRTYLVDPREFCRALMTHAAADFYPDTNVHTMQQDPTNGTYLITSTQHTFAAATVLLANAAHANLLQHAATFRIVQGQVMVGIPSAAVRSVTLPLCFNGYLLPAWQDDGFVLLGATYERKQLQTAPTDENNDKMKGNLQKLLHHPDASFTITPVRSRIADRAVTTDRLPVCGSIGEKLYLLAGHGSRGLHSAPLGGALIAAMITGSDELPGCAPGTLTRFCTALSPQRFAAPR
jgi:tRNA 5-methylaminomethyl-2-thiouridine biosynthesis bifunctional protein